MELINRIRKSRKGFTLVEIIVVLVILAILAAFTIPTMLGFVKDAKAKAMIAEAREVYVAAQSTATEYSLATTSTLLNSNGIKTRTDDTSKQMVKYIGTDLSYGEATSSQTMAVWTVTLSDVGKVDTVTYTRDSRTIVITAGGTTTVS
ncbi:MAG: type II secretion system GspH family protein [Firmicutes bacterium]|nr:type II secretion system GspH family protein [Bacillota bacterium]